MNDPEKMVQKYSKHAQAARNVGDKDRENLAHKVIDMGLRIREAETESSEVDPKP